MTKRSVLRFLILLTVASFTSDANAITPAEFAGLSTSDKEATVAAAFERRLEQARNFSYHTSVQLRNFTWSEGKLGSPVSKGIKREYHHWLLGNDFRIDTKIYRQFSLDEVTLVSKSAFPATDGVGRYFSVRPSEPQKSAQGRIDTAGNPSITENRYSYWLYGREVPDADFLFPSLLAQREHFQFNEVDGSLVILTVPWIPFGESEPKGERLLWLDIEKGFMPIRGEARWEEEGAWRRESFEVEDSKLVGETWMPTKMREIVRTPATQQRGQALVLDTTADELSCGQVTANDVRLDFPEGTYVVDAIEGIAYYVDQHGQPVGEPSRLIESNANGSK